MVGTLLAISICSCDQHKQVSFVYTDYVIGLLSVITNKVTISRSVWQNATEYNELTIEVIE